MEENENQNLFYVTDPKEEKDNFGKFISYLLKGSKIIEPLPRRYREFDLLRSKLVDRFPGIWIPPLPRKKLVGNKNVEIVNLRVDQINRFCKLIGNNPTLYNSQEVTAFLSNVGNVEKAINALPKEKYPEFLTRYKNIYQIPPVNKTNF